MAVYEMTLEDLRDYALENSTREFPVGSTYW